MLKIDIQQVDRYGDTFFNATDTAYLIFLVIGIVGYFTVPSVANYIVHAGGGYTLLHKASNLFTGGARSAMSTAAIGAGAVATSMTQSLHRDGGNDEGKTKEAQSGSEYMHDKLSGKK
jgi:hypothetical protein